MAATIKKRKSVRIVINSLGECYRQCGQQDDPCGSNSINIAMMAKKVLTSEDDAVWSQFKSQTPEWKVIDGYLRRCIQHQFQEDAYNEMPLPVYGFYNVVGELQSGNDGQFRVWGEMHGETFKSKQHIWLVTEFMSFVDNKGFWKKLRAQAKESGCTLRTMYTSPHLDKRWEVGVNGHKKGNPLTDKTAIIGKNHGRSERQVEFRVDLAEGVEPFDLAGLQEKYKIFRSKMEVDTQWAWELAGVGVL